MIWNVICLIVMLNRCLFKDGIYSIDEIFELKFIRNRRIETLQNIASNMSKQLSDNSYMNLFEEKINEMSRTNVKRKNYSR